MEINSCSVLREGVNSGSLSASSYHNAPDSEDANRFQSLSKDIPDQRPEGQSRSQPEANTLEDADAAHLGGASWIPMGLFILDGGEGVHSGGRNPSLTLAAPLLVSGGSLVTRPHAGIALSCSPTALSHSLSDLIKDHPGVDRFVLSLPGLTEIKVAVASTGAGLLRVQLNAEEERLHQWLATQRNEMSREMSRLTGASVNVEVPDGRIMKDLIG